MELYLSACSKAANVAAAKTAASSLAADSQQCGDVSVRWAGGVLVLCWGAQGLQGRRQGPPQTPELPANRPAWGAL